VPELPEVETVRQGLNSVTLHQTIVGGDVLLERTIAHPFSVDEFLQGLVGTEMITWSRRGKYLLASLQRDRNPAGWLGVHLRMTGQLLWTEPADALQKHCRVRLFLHPSRELRYVDQRTFGRLWWVPPDCQPQQVITGLQQLGAEPLSADFTVDYLADVVKKSHRPIKNALLDQRLIAGLGNIYADEALFLSGIHPQVHGADLAQVQVEKLHYAIVQVLQDSIQAGGTSFSNFLSVEGINGNYGGVAWVYHRSQQPCRRCQTPIQRIKLAGRSAHFCPQCQR
jgi:formamidopyrimidine-DNA glycosylase